MNVLEPTPEHARRELAGIADPLSEDDDLVVAYARAIWSCLVEPGDRVAGALIATCGPVRALEIADSVRMIEMREQTTGGRRFERPFDVSDRGPAGPGEPLRLGQSYRRTLHRHSAAAARRDRSA